jgi:hypothetical protein
MPSDFSADHFAKAFRGIRWDKLQPRLHFLHFEASLIDGIHLAAPNVKADVVAFLRDGTLYPELDARPEIQDDASEAAWKRYERLEKIWDRKKSLRDEFDNTCLFALQAIHDILPEHLRIHCQGPESTLSTGSLHDCFDSLKEIFGRPNNSEFNQILAALQAKMDRSVSLQDHIHAHKRYHQILASADQTMAPALQVNLLRDSLPDYFTPFLDLFDSRTPQIDDLDFDNFTNSIQIWAENRPNLPGGKAAAVMETLSENSLSHSDDMAAAAVRTTQGPRPQISTGPSAMPTLMSIHSELTALTNMVNQGFRPRQRSRGGPRTRGLSTCPEHPGANHDASQCWVLHPELRPPALRRSRQQTK